MLFRLFETHLVWSLTKNTAASSITRLTGMLRMKSQAVNPHMIQEIEKSDPEQALVLKRSLLLGSPRTVLSPGMEDFSRVELLGTQSKKRANSTHRSRAGSNVAATATNTAAVAEPTPLLRGVSPTPARKKSVESSPDVTTPPSTLNINLFSPVRQQVTAPPTDTKRSSVSPMRNAAVSSRAKLSLESEDQP